MTSVECQIAAGDGYTRSLQVRSEVGRIARKVSFFANVCCSSFMDAIRRELHESERYACIQPALRKGSARAILGQSFSAGGFHGETRLDNSCGSERMNESTTFISASSLRVSRSRALCAVGRFGSGSGRGGGRAEIRPAIKTRAAAVRKGTSECGQESVATFVAASRFWWWRCFQGNTVLAYLSGREAARTPAVCVFRGPT